jgi:hypothetical protein
MNPLVRIALLPLLAAAFASPSGAVSLAAGANDGFLAPPDTVVPSAALKTVLGSYGGVQNYDLVAGVNGANDRQVAHTFTGLGGLTSGTLEIRVRAGQVTGVENDGIFLSFVDSPTDSYAQRIVWRRSFGAISAIPPWYPEDDPGLVGTSWMPDDEVLILLDLRALPMPDGSTLDLIPQIATRGYLDVNVSDETGVDYAFVQGELGATGTPLAGIEPSDLRAFPNPFLTSTSLAFTVRETGPVRLGIYDVAGRPVRTDWRVDWAPGRHTLAWDGRDDGGRRVAAGVYWARLEGAGSVQTIRLVHLR